MKSTTPSAAWTASVQVTADVHARYFGGELDNQSLTPGDNPRIAPTRFDDWLRQAAK